LNFNIKTGNSSKVFNLNPFFHIVLC
jgi:hypothetical protein